MSEATLFPEPPAAPQPTPSPDFETFFTEFWGRRGQRGAYPHRKGTRDRMEARQLLLGQLRMKDGSKITPEDWPDILAGAWAARELDGGDEYRWNACRWLRAGGWHDALDRLEEQDRETRETHQRAAKRRRRDVWRPPTPEERRKDDERARLMLAERSNGSDDHENVIGLPTMGPTSGKER